MSRIGRKEILIPGGVTVDVTDSKVVVKGTKGELELTVRPEIGLKMEDGKLTTFIKKDTKEANAFWGMTRALIANMIKGVTEGFEKKLELVGVGYRAKPVSGGISLSLGFSHPVEFTSPKGITLNVPDPTTIIISGSDKQLVGLTAARIRKFRKPEPYKGKGIKYSNEYVRRKAGKSAKA